jgi:membrane fusion protein (multidrug efflux system)
VSNGPSNGGKSFVRTAGGDDGSVSPANGFFTFLRRRPKVRRTLTLVAAALVVTAAVAWLVLSGRESTDDAQIDAHITPLAARVAGTVVSVEVSENQPVEAGAVLLRLDPTDYRVAVDRAQADLDAAKSALAAARSGLPITAATTSNRLRSADAGVTHAEAAVASARDGLAAAQARLEEAQARAEQAGRDRERLERLIAKDEVSHQQYDAAVAGATAADATVKAAAAAVRQAEQAETQARAALTNAQAELAAARTAPEQVAVTRAQADSAAARAAQAKAALEQAELNLRYTTVAAPAAGVIGKRNVEIGQIVQAGQPLFALVDLADVWVTANFKETQLANIRPGQRARIKVDATGQTLRGHVDSIAGATGARFSLLPPENASGNYVKVVQRVPVKILLEAGQDPERLLRPGMSVVPTVFTR